MHTKLKQRIVGTTVITLLAVIFLPMLLDGKPKNVKIHPMQTLIEETALNQHTESTLLQENMVASKDDVSIYDFWEEIPYENTGVHSKLSTRRIINQSTKKSDEHDKKNNHQKKQHQKTQTPDKTKNSVVKKINKIVGKSTQKKWVVQAGTYSKQQNALNFKKKLDKSGMHALVEEYKKGNKIQYRVKVGPVDNKDDARDYQIQLKKSFGVNGWLTSLP